MALTTPTIPDSPPEADGVDADSPSAAQPGALGTLGMLITLLLALIPLSAYTMIRLPLEAHLGLSVGLMGVGMIVLRRFPRLRIAAMLLSIAASSRYLYWRAAETLFFELTADGALSMALFGAEIFGFMIMIGGYFQTAIVTNRKPVPLPEESWKLPTVDVFIPTYNEPIEVLRRTVVGAMSISYPKKKVYILDDTPRTHKNAKKAAQFEVRRAAVAALAQEVGCIAVRRPDNSGAKAGNINHALTKTDGELVAIFDADHVPVRTFLQATVGFFVQDPKIALVQTPHHFYNPDPFERNLFFEGRLPPEQHLFYHRIQKGNDFWNSAFFCGSCAVLRRKAVEQVGGIAQQTVTEDAHTALKLHAKGWHSRYLDIPQAAGLATERFGFHVQQRIRWARGMSQILSIDNPLFKKGLTLAQRFNYFNAATHFLFGLPRLVYMTSPAAFILIGLHPLNADVRQVLVYALPHLFLSAACTASVNKNTRYSFWPEVYETSIAWYTAWVTTVALFFPRFGTFNVTPKGGNLDRAEFDWRSARPMLVLFALALVSLAVLPARVATAPSQWDTILVAGVWNIYNLVVLSAGIAVALERPERRQYTRIKINGNVALSAREVQSVDPWSGSTPLPAIETHGPSTRTPVLHLAPTPADQGPWVPPPPAPNVPAELRALATGGRNLPAPKKRTGDIVDLSETGARIHLHGSDRLPVLLHVTLMPPSGNPLVLDARVVNQRPGQDDHLVVGVEFENVTAEQRIYIIQMMFTEPDTWVRERFVEDKPLRSAMDVLGSPVLVAFFHLTKRVPALRHAGEPLTTFHVSAKCPVCQSTQLAVFDKCAKCGGRMPPAEPPVPSRPRGAIAQISHFTRGIAALPLLALAGAFAVGWKPIVDPLQSQLATLYEDRVTPTRVGELAGAHRELRSLQRQLEWAQLPLAPQLPMDWSKRLWGARYGYELDSRDDREWQEVVVVLDEAATDLEAAGRAYRENAGKQEIRRNLDRAAERLDVASRELAVAIQNEEAR